MNLSHIVVTASDVCPQAMQRPHAISTAYAALVPAVNNALQRGMVMKLLAVGDMQALSRQMPLFMIASAAEAGPSSSVQSWQLVVANLAAGATAGCAVEAGKQHPGVAVCCRCGVTLCENTPQTAFASSLFCTACTCANSEMLQMRRRKGTLVPSTLHCFMHHVLPLCLSGT